jgi:gliding motility-associated-like protein
MIRFLHHKTAGLILFQLLLSILVLAQPKANFTVSTTSGCSPLTVKFTNTSSGGTAPFTWLWRLGNTNISTNKDASAIYVTPKTYFITLIATDNLGKIDSITKTVIVYGSPTADFKSDVITGCPPFSVNFTDMSVAGSGGITTWLWDFDDGVTSGNQNPSHTFTTTGKFNISLLVTDKNGCSKYVKKTSYIVSNTAPVIDFSASPPGGCSAPVSINFSSTVNPSSSNYTYSWDFGDGGTSSSANPSYTYSAAGTYSVTLKISDNTGCTATKIKNSFIFIGKPKAGFSYSPGSGCSPLGVNFTNSSAGAVKYSWDFGDGKTSTDQDPVHNFNVGSYTVTLVATSASGCSDTFKTGPIKVTPGFTASFSGDSVLCQHPYTANFKNTSGSAYTVVSWDFGDNKTSSAANPTHIYPDTGGYYSVTLTVTDGNGCYESVKKTNFIHAQATSAAIGYSNFEGCAPFIFNFTNNSSSIDPIISYLWDFGDKTTSTAANPANHTYTDTGSFILSLKIKTQLGCTSAASVKINSGSHPKADFSATPLGGCLNNLRHVHFTNLTNVASATIKADRYAWDFGDGEYSYDISPTHRYHAKPGKYTVKLTAYNKGCADTLIKKNLIIISGPWAKYVVKMDGCAPNIVSFYDSSIGANHVKYVFGDGTSDTVRNPVHNYSAGTYKPYQIVYNDTTGCTDTFSLYFVNPLVISSPWSVNITTNSSTSGCTPLTVDFNITDNDSADNVVNFGDGDSVTVSSIGVPSQVVSHTYIKKGTYKVTVKGTNKRGCQVNINFNATVVVSGAFAKFSVDKSGGCIPLKVLLTDSSTKDNTITKKIYRLGTGDILNVTRDTMSYVFTKAPANQYGGYTITEEVSDNTGCTNFFSLNVYPSLPVSDFTIDSNVTCKQTIYSFVPTDNGLGPFKYAWDLGNGTKSVLRAPVLTYKNGSYTVHLTMTDANGCTDSNSHKFIAVKTFSHADFTADSTFSQCPPFHVFFHDNSRFAFGGYHSYEWDFGDGSPRSFVKDPEKVYYDAGNFDVTLKITDSLGCTDSIIKKNLIVVKGAVGTYSFDVKRGCTPLTVHFKAVSSNASKFVWDMGDGTLKSGDTVTYTYKGTRSYVPLLTLSDSAGCTYTLAPKDTIFVDALPVPDFRYDSICSGAPTYFSDASSASSGQLVKWDWEFGDGSKGSGKNPSHTYLKNGYYIVSLTVANSQGCSKKGLKKIRIGGLKADFVSTRTGCVGTPVQFTDKTQSDTTIRSWFWDFGDGFTSTLQNPVHTYYKKGKYGVSLFADNFKGCFDSTSKGGYQVIGDTVPPQPLILYRVSVAGDSSVQVVFSRYRDVDFDQYRIYMKDINGNFSEIDRTYDVNDTAHIVKNLSTLHNVYCFKVQAVNACGKVSTLTPYHCTIDLTALPGNDQAFLNWTPYTGWNKVAKYRIYRMSYYNPPQYALIDSVPGDILNYTDTGVICYRTDIYKVEALEDSGYRQFSWSDTSAAKPVHINRVPAANLVRVTVPDNRNNLVEWKDIPALKVMKWMVEKSTDGTNYTPLDSPFNRNVLSVIDRKVDVQHKNYYYRMRIQDSCGDVGPYSTYGRNIVLSVDTTPDVLPSLRWTPYRKWSSVRSYHIEIKDANGIYQVLDSVNGTDTSYIDKLTDRNSLPQYCYRIIALNGEDAAVTSMSNEACLKVKSRIYVPNAFTPYNGDQLNDVFQVKGLYIREFHIKIFDRWGTKIFESSSLKNCWDGRYKGRRPLIDAYKYEIYMRGADNEVYFLNGWITLVE